MAELQVELDGIRQNTAAVKELLNRCGLQLVAVTKACMGEPAVAAAMLDGGADALADSRETNLRRLRGARLRAEIHRIHLPYISRPFDPGDLTYVSSLAGAWAVARIGSRSHPRRVVVLMETGDRREGVPEHELEGLVEVIGSDPRLEFAGIATNYACFAGPPEGVRASVERLAIAARSLRARGLAFARVSGGNSSHLALLRAGERFPREITELRCGEALLLGHDALVYSPLPGCRPDACRIRAEVLEEYTKPLLSARRLVLDVGSQDLGSGAVLFLAPDLREAGRSGDYLVAEAGLGSRSLGVGDHVEMIPSYTALLAAWSSPFVEVKLV